MMSNIRIQHKNKTKIIAGAAFLVFMTSSNVALAASTSWSSQPAWASGESTRRSHLIKESNNLSPFSPASNNVSLDVGQTFLLGDLSGRYSNNIGAKLHYTYGVSDMFGFDSSLGYSSHSGASDTLSFSCSSLNAGIRMNLSWYDKVIPHMVLGLGFYRPSYSFGEISDSAILFGLHMGPGVDLELTKQMFFGTQLTFHDIFGYNRIATNGQKIDFGGVYSSFLLRAGVTF